MAWRVVAAKTAVVVLAVLVPVLFVGNGLYLLTHGWFVRAQYARSDFPEDAFGMETPERTRLAIVGLSSILPWHREGSTCSARRGSTTARPRSTAASCSTWATSAGCSGSCSACTPSRSSSLVVLAAVRRTRDLARRSLRAGSFVTLGLFAFVGVLLAVDADWFMTGFHTIFFKGTSWRFADTETLRRLFPDLFWGDTRSCSARRAAAGGAVAGRGCAGGRAGRTRVRTAN